MKNRLAELRRQYGVSQTDLSVAHGVPLQTIVHLEQGLYEPSIAEALQLSRIFGLQIEDIFLYEPSTVPQAAEAQGS